VQLARDKFQHLTDFPAAYVLAVAGLAGIAGWGAFVWSDQQLRTGLGVTGMNAPTYWGAYIINFVFFVGLSAGGIVVSALVHALRIERYRAVARIAEVVAILSILSAGLFITLDVGRPDRLWHLVRYGRWQSPLVWDMFIISIYLAMALGLGYFSTRADIVKCMRAMPQRARLYRLLALGYVDTSPKALERDGKILRALAFASLPGAVLLHSVTAWILGLAKSTPGWHTSLLAPLFVGSALVSGLALVIVAAEAGRRLFQANVPESTVVQLGRLLALAIPLLGYFLFSELLTVMYARETSPAAFFEELIHGDYAYFFWFDLIVGLIAPLLILVRIWLAPARAPQAAAERARAGAGLRVIQWGFAAAGAALAIVGFLASNESPTAALGFTGVRIQGIGFVIAVCALAGVASAALAFRAGPAGGTAIAGFLVVIGVLAERINIVLAPQFTRFSPHPEETFALPYPVAPYGPTWQELSIVAGVYAVAVLGFAIFAKVFPLVELEEDVGERRPSEPARRGFEASAEGAPA